MFTKRLERMHKPPSDLQRYENEPYTQNPLLKFRLRDVYEQRHYMFLRYRAAKSKLNASQQYRRDERTDLEEPLLPQWHYVDNLRRSARKIDVPRMLVHIEKKILQFGMAVYKNRYPEIVAAYMTAVHEHFNQLMYSYSVQILIRHPPKYDGAKENEGNSDADSLMELVSESKEFRLLSAGRTKKYEKFLEKRRKLARQLLITELPVRYVLSSSETDLPHVICDFEFSFSGHEQQLLVRGIGGRNAGPYRSVHKHVRHDIEKLTTHLRWTWYPRVVATLKRMFRKRTMAATRWTRTFVCIEGLINRQINNMKQATLRKLLDVVGDPRRIPMLCLNLECRPHDNQIDLDPSLKMISDMYVSIVNELMEVGKKLEPLQPQVNPSIFGFTQANLKVGMNPVFVREFLLELKLVLKRTYQPLMLYVDEFRTKYHDLRSLNVIEELNEFLSSPHSFDEYFAKIDIYLGYIRTLLSEPRYEFFEFAVIRNELAVQSLRQATDELVSRIVRSVVHEHQRTMELICADFQAIKERALEVPKSTEDLLESAEYMVLVKKQKIDELRERILKAMEVGNSIVELTEMDQGHLELTIDTINWLLKIDEICDYNASQQEQYKIVFEEHLQDVVKKLNMDIVALVPKLSVIDDMSDPNKFRDSYILLQNIIDQLKVFDVYVRWVNKEEKLFKIPQTVYPTLEVLKDFVYPFAALIKLCIDWLRYYHVWLDGPFEYLEPDFVEETTARFLKNFEHNQKYYHNKIKQDLIDQPVCKFRGQTEDPDPEKHPVPLRLCNKMINSIIKDFMTGVLVVRIMCNPALRKRHWKEMSDIAGFDMSPDAGTTLRKILAFGLDDKLDQFEIISVSANKEKLLQDNLHSMMKEWDSCVFPTARHKDTNLIILTSLDDIQALLDDHILKTLSMRGSAFMKPCEHEVLPWYEQIMRVNRTFDEWTKLQSSFLNLLPIFSSDDIIAEMPEEASMFNLVKQTFNESMEMIQQEPLVMKTGPAVGLLESLERAIQLLEKISNGVNNYLEKKRLVFPRFFFLSNDQMLEILSETTDPLRVQPHLSKCFEGIERLQFTAGNDGDGDESAWAMQSREGEQVEFIGRVNMSTKSGGNIEKLLVSIESEMLRTVHCETEMAYTDYSKTDTKLWITKWPQMVVLCVSQIHWASRVHATLRSTMSSNASALPELFDELAAGLNDLVLQIRACDIKTLHRLTLKTLIVIGVHAKDVVEQMYRCQIVSDCDFQWVAQLRYYWEDDCAIVRIMSAMVPYGNEYLGNSDRLVITPLTERCFRTLIAAYQRNLNGAPEGPAGTGKTETAKDLAKALAVQCKVFNCSDGLDYKAMGKFLKGLACCGAWACFDEFNRIDLEVLSVVAQQLLLIIQALRAKVTKFFFDSVELSLKPSCYVCITMNPGYAGRNELPDNLKIFFRPVAMMVPDYTTISEIFLFSYGFMDARNLSVKIMTAYRLCSEQLSKQNHYDYGMRAVMSVLMACGKLKSHFPNELEDSLLLRSLIDVNMPKFMAFDIPLFEAIINDIFPGNAIPKNDYSLIEREFRFFCDQMSLQSTASFLGKVIQTYEMMAVRHGFMLVGQPMAGKSTTLKIIAKILSKLKGTSTVGDSCEFQDVQMTVINPKAVTMPQLYGHLDAICSEWHDGLVSRAFRKFASSKTLDRKWLIFDAPIDALWVENLNTVLDDNRKLCLISGEVIPMTKEMSMIFEVMDLAQASPATVSRCGMIYMEPDGLGWESIAKSSLKNCDHRWADEENVSYVMQLLSWLLPPCQNFLRRNCNQHIWSGELNCMKTTFDLFEMLLHEAIEENLEEYQKFLSVYFQAALLFSLAWGLAGILDATSREKFDNFLREMWSSDDDSLPVGIGKLEISMPSEGLLVDYVYVFKQRGGWKSWHELVKRMDVEVTSQGIQVPTIETARYSHLLELHIKYKKRMLLVGPSGTGKSAYIQNYLMNKVDTECYETGFMTLTVMISANQTQELLISKLSKLKRGIYGPSKGKTSIIFVDDLNMPAKESFGAQPPLELLRQYFDYDFLYDFKDGNRITFKDLMIVAACGLPGGSRQKVYTRFLNHFNIFSVNSFTVDTINRIFVNVLLYSLKRAGHGNDVAGIANQIVSASQDVYKTVQTELRATPSKSHYLFNVRDISRIVAGCALLRKDSISDRRIFVRAWYHESLRVFSDRLICAEDRMCVFGKLNECVRLHFKESVEGVFESYLPEGCTWTLNRASKISFGSYMDRENIADDRRYEEITNSDAFLNLAMKSLEQYNSTRGSKIDLTFFDFALQHLNRICRVISIPGASALLIGMGGSGRQSLTKLATNIVQTSFFQPEIIKVYGIKDWHQDIKRVLKEAGGSNRHTVFLMTENQLKSETYLQDIDCLLNQGEVPNIYAIDEKQEILDLVRLAAQGGNRNIDISPLQVFSFFLGRCKQKLHIVLGLSPIGDSLRTRVRLYPSLVNCCTIDWYQCWPEEALQMIARKSFASLSLGTEELTESIVLLAQHFHVSAARVIEDFCEKTGRRIYLTNAAFLEFIHSFESAINRRQNEVICSKARYIGGLDTLAKAENAISRMQIELNALQPKLLQLAENSRQMLVEINTETVAASAAAEQVKRDEIVAGVQAQAAQALKSECEKDLAQAIPVLEDAIQALNTLKPADITLVKSMKNPPPVIKLVMAAVCVIKGLPPDRIADPATGKMINDYWGPSKRILGDMNFLQSLKDFDKDNINPEIMKKIRKDFIPNKDFQPKIVAKASSAAEGLCKWIIAMDLYDNVAKIVAPKKAKLAAAEKEYAVTMKILNEKRLMAAALEEKVARLNRELERANAEMQRTQAESDYCQSKLWRAEALISSLGGEKSRWTDAAESLQAVYESLPGDILLSCGIIAYLSTVNLCVRRSCVTDWHELCMSSGIPCSQSYSISKALGLDVTIQSWNVKGLPRDIFSIENAIISMNSSRYSLFIDPQGQANSWIKNMERKNHLICVKFNQANYYMKAVAEAVERGYPLIVENVLEELDESLNPILTHDVFMQGEKEYISLGDKIISFSKNFRLYMTCNLRNPHFLPEIFNKVTIINFVLTQGALEDQLLNIVVAKERPDLQELRMNLISEAAQNKADLIHTENMILQTLSGSDGDILENEKAIGILSESKELCRNIASKQNASTETERKIEAFCLNFKPVATHAAVLYYAITDLPAIDPMYQFSTQWYINLYQFSIENANKSKELARRIKFLVDGITRNLYNNICRSIFEKDKLLFSFILTCRILLSSQQLHLHQISHLFSNSKQHQQPLYTADVVSSQENPDNSWIKDIMWWNICRLEECKELSGFIQSFSDNRIAWKNIYDHATPERQEFPMPWRDRTTRFEKLMILKALRPDRVFLAVRQFIADEMGEAYVSPPEFDLSSSYVESNALTPLIFILSPGTDPLDALYAFAEKMGKEDSVQTISLGQGQGPIAQAMIKNAQELGNWICLQNCHLAASWMTTLEYIWENMDTFNTATSFRLWLTSYPTLQFPVALLQHGIKITKEPPTGLKENIMRSYNSEPISDPLFYTGCAKQDRAFTSLLFGICFFHAVVQERREYGSLGWNIPYGFNESDLQISVLQLNELLNQYDEVPYDALSYLVSECNYGGRVTDYWDQRAVKTLLSDYVSQLVVSESRLSIAPDYYFILPRKTEHREVLRYVESNVPSLAHPEVFGMHANAGIIRDLQTTNALFDSMMILMENEIIVYNNGTTSVGDSLEHILNRILQEMPENLNIEIAKQHYPLDYNESMNAVLVQELERFLELQILIRNSCRDLQLAMNGDVVMTPQLEDLMNSLNMNRIPSYWITNSYSSLKSMSSYILDLFKRLEWLKNWIEYGKPSTYWISGFFFPQAFLTGALQNFARKHRFPIDSLTFDYEVLQVESIENIPDDGVYINGLFIEGARWLWEDSHLEEQLPKILVYAMPAIYLKPLESLKLLESGRYKCPLYRTAERRGNLSTMGHSTNFVTSLLLTSLMQPEHWIKRGTALICQTTS